jgi:hypothetical protein
MARGNDPAMDGSFVIMQASTDVIAPQFKPFTLTIVVESEKEMAELYARFNVGPGRLNSCGPNECDMGDKDRAASKAYDEIVKAAAAMGYRWQ